MSNGIRTTNLERQFSIDELLGNVTADGVEKTARIPMSAVATALAGTGPFILGNTVYSLTFAALPAPANATQGAVVLNDPDPTKNGTYAANGATWTFGRSFDTSFAKVTLSGSGTAQTGVLPSGTNPAGVGVYYARVTTPNTGPLTLSIQGGTARDIVNVAGNPLSAGEWTGMVMFVLNEDGDYQLLIHAGAAAAAALSATNAAASAAAAAAFGSVSFDLVADLLADENDVIGYVGSGASVEVAAGFKITAQGFRYEVAAADAVDEHATTAGGVKLYVLPDTLQCYSVLAWGAVADGIATGDAAIVQKAVDSVPDGSVLVAFGLHLNCTTIITVTDKRLTFLGGKWFWNHTDTNLIKLAGTLDQPRFVGMEIYGTGTAFSSFGAIGCSSGTETVDWLVDDCYLHDLPFGVYFNADSSGSHVHPVCRNTVFRRMVRYTDSDTSGVGLGLVFASRANAGMEAAQSIGNTFDTCGRHGLYSSGGGEITSIGDTWVRHRDDGHTLFQTDLGACQLSRSSGNITLISPRFVGCRDLALSIQGVQTSGAQTFGAGITVIAPIFDGNLAGDVKINNDGPLLNGWINDFTMTDTLIRQYGLSNAARISLLAGKRIKIDGVRVEADLSLGSTNFVNLVRIDDVASASEFDEILVRDMRGYDAGTLSRGVAVDAGILTGTSKVRLEDINFGNSATIFESATTPTNPNYLKLSGGKPVVNSAFTGSFTNKNSEINKVDKYAGKMVFSVSSNAPLWATGSSDTSTWVNGAGTVVHTPA